MIDRHAHASARLSIALLIQASPYTYYHDWQWAKHRMDDQPSRQAKQKAIYLKQKQKTIIQVVREQPKK